MLETKRLLRRPWQEGDRKPFAAMNADPVVMQHFPSVLSENETDTMIKGTLAHFERHGFGLWAVEVKATEAFAGFVGLAVPGFEAHFTPCVEIGWRLAKQYWHQGFATEGAAKVLGFAFAVLLLPEVVSFTSAANMPSRRVMERIGMTHDAHDDFDHPGIAPGSPLCRHVLYRKRR